MDRLEYLIEIINGAMKGLGITGHIRRDGIPHDQLIVELRCGSEEKPHTFEDRPTAGTVCLICTKNLSEMYTGEPFRFGPMGRIVHK